MSKRFALGVLLVSLATSLQASEFEAQHHKLWVPDGIQPGALRGVLIHRNYGAEPRLYTKENWRALAKELGFAQLLFAPSAGEGKKDDVSARQAQLDIERLDRFLAAAAAETGHRELVGIPFVTLGVSRGGANSIVMAYAAPDRAIAAVGFHGESIIGSDRVKKPNLELPVFYPIAENDPKRNARIEEYVRGTMRQRHGAPWTMYLHKGASHNSTGNDDFTFAWLRAVLALRMGEKGSLKTIDWAQAHGGDFTLKDAGTAHASFTGCKIAPEPPRNSTLIWLPTQETADAWLKNHAE